MFVQKGYQQATVNDILDKVEIGKGTFYHYFKSKEDVMNAVIGRMVERVENTNNENLIDPDIMSEFIMDYCLEVGEYMFKIGEFSKLSNISVISLRHYESSDLLLPIRIKDAEDVNKMRFMPGVMENILGMASERV